MVEYPRAGSESNIEVDDSGIDVGKFVESHYREYVIDTSGADPTIEIIVYPPYDTCFLDSIGRFFGPKTGSFVGFELPISKLGLLNTGRKIRFTYAQKVQIPERWNYATPRNWGYLVIGPCGIMGEWFPVSLTIRRTDSIQTEDARSVTLTRSLNSERKQAATHHLPPGTYDCIFELDRNDAFPDSVRSFGGLMSRCDRVVLYDVFISAGQYSIITSCEFLDSRPLGYEDDNDGETCRFPWEARVVE